MNVRKRKFSKAIMEGQSQKAAAIEAGYAPSRAEQTGSELAKDPEVRADIEKALAKHDLTRERVAQEIDRGLKEANIEGKHGEYVDRTIDLLGIGSKAKDGSPMHIGIIMFAQKIATEGIIEADGSRRMIADQTGGAIAS